MKKATLVFIITLLFTASGFSQNVGIGTTTPNFKLHVTSGDLFVNSATGSIRFGIEGSNQWRLANTGGGSTLLWATTTDGINNTYHHNFSQSGNVGIGTGLTSPTEAKLQVFEPVGNTQFIAAAGSNLPGISTFVPVSSPSIGFNMRYQNGYKFMGAGHGAFWQYRPSIGRLDYYHSSTDGLPDGNASLSFALSIDSSGQMGIGTSTPKAPLHVTGNVVFGSASITPAVGYKVSIDGKVICEELRVQTSSAWPDYVFKPGYKLLTLEDLEKSIIKNNHLPNIPAAAEIEKNGFDLGDMNRRLLEKVEELTLYIIQLEKNNKALESRMNKLENPLAATKD